MDFLTLAAERQFVAASRLTPTPGCASCLAPGRADNHVEKDNLCLKCSKSGAYLRAAVEAPDALRKLADELEDAIAERHEATAVMRLARVVEALTEQIEAVIELTDAMASRRPPTAFPTQYPTGGFGLFGRGVWKAPWMGPNGEMVLVAVDAAHRVIGRPVTLPLGSDYIARADVLWRNIESLEKEKPVEPCVDCGSDVEGRRGNAVRCVECAASRVRGRTLECRDCTKSFTRSAGDGQAVRCQECRKARRWQVPR